MGYNKDMKQVLLVDSSHSFFTYLKDALNQQQVQLEQCVSSRTAYTTLINLLPDLILIDIGDLDDTTLAFLEKKSNDPNAKTIPVIAIGDCTDRKKIAQLVAFGVQYYYRKPIKYDQFFKAIGKILGTNFEADHTESILELHVNDSILFVEISDGLNRDKIAMLRDKIKAVTSHYKIGKPKMVVMLSNLDLCFLDMTNITLLLDTILEDRIIKKANIKIITNETFVADLIKGHDEYTGIEVVDTIDKVINPLLEIFAISDSKDPLIQRVLKANRTVPQNEIELYFSTDYNGTMQKPYDSGEILRVAIIDDDPVTQKILAATFDRINASPFVYGDGVSILNDLAGNQFDLIILDIMIPNMNGMDILRNLQRRNYPASVIVYSQMTDKNSVMESLTLGARRFLVKPQKPEAIIQSTLEVLKDENEI